MCPRVSTTAKPRQRPERHTVPYCAIVSIRRRDRGVRINADPGRTILPPRLDSVCRALRYWQQLDVAASRQPSKRHSATPNCFDDPTHFRDVWVTNEGACAPSDAEASANSAPSQRVMRVMLLDETLHHGGLCDLRGGELDRQGTLGG